jgi:hypothetical protein
MKKLIFALSVLTLVFFAGCAKIFDGLIETVNPDGVSSINGNGNGSGTNDGNNNNSTGSINVRIFLGSDWMGSPLSMGPLQLAMVPYAAGATPSLDWSGKTVTTLNWSNLIPDQASGKMTISGTVNAGSSSSYKLIVWQPRSGADIVSAGDPSGFVQFNFQPGAGYNFSNIMSPADLSRSPYAEYELIVAEHLPQTVLDELAGPAVPIAVGSLFQINLAIDRSDSPQFVGKRYSVDIWDNMWNSLGTATGRLDSFGRLPSTLIGGPYTASHFGGSYKIRIIVDLNDNGSFLAGNYNGSSDMAYNSEVMVNTDAPKIGSSYQFLGAVDSSSSPNWYYY